MDNRERQKINYIELLRAIAEHWKPLIQDKQFYWAMLKWIICMVAFTAFMIFGLSLDSTGEELGELMDEIRPPSDAVLIKSVGMRKGLASYYSFSGMIDEEVRSYYKKELKEKKWKYEKREGEGDEIYSKSVYKSGYTLKYTFRVQKSRSEEYDWILEIYKK